MGLYFYFFFRSNGCCGHASRLESSSYGVKGDEINVLGGIYATFEEGTVGFVDVKGTVGFVDVMGIVGFIDVKETVGFVEVVATGFD